MVSAVIVSQSVMSFGNLCCSCRQWVKSRWSDHEGSRPGTPRQSVRGISARFTCGLYSDCRSREQEPTGPPNGRHRLIGPYRQVRSTRTRPVRRSFSNDHGPCPFLYKEIFGSVVSRLNPASFIVKG